MSCHVELLYCTSTHLFVITSHAVLHTHNHVTWPDTTTICIPLHRSPARVAVCSSGEPNDRCGGWLVGKLLLVLLVGPLGSGVPLLLLLLLLLLLVFKIHCFDII